MRHSEESDSRMLAIELLPLLLLLLLLLLVGCMRG
jgi:hypothetical protein